MYRNRASAALVSILIWVIGTAMTILLSFAMFFAAVLLYPFDKKRKAAHAQCYWWSDILTRFNPYWNVKVKGLENIDRKKTYVVVVNHQSLADIVVLYRIKMQFKWVAKASLFKVPFVGWSLSLAKHIRLTRGKFTSIKKVYREAAEWLRKGVSVLFFPEGTRSRTDEMNEFQNGAFKLAIKEKRHILPISINGTRDAIPRGSWLFKTKVLCNLTVLEPIDTSQFQPGDFGRLKEIVRERLSRQTVKL